jgi:N-carbamoyl-L-amino-acid hydrolase
VLAGLELLRTLNDNQVETERDIVLVNWTNEEGARFAPAMLSSGVWTGQFSEAYAHARAITRGSPLVKRLAIGYRGETCPAFRFTPATSCTSNRGRFWKMKPLISGWSARQWASAGLP